ncbi:hypothetical protein N9Y92_00675 [Chlamydiales bacterium]|nr:hypothetical protein [Chlamydiales bacterium]
MKKNTDLTNEKLKKRFPSQFDLVTYAIELAENMVLSGRESRVKTDVESKAYQILAEIMVGKDKFEEIPENSYDEDFE